MQKNRSNYRRPVAAVGAVALAATLILGGTMAWQSISQVVKNENAQPVNAGGRIHDDFNGTTKDVYAENFGDTELIVRIRLDEFMELGEDAGKDSPDTNTKRKPVDEGTSIDKPETWKTHTLEGKLGSHQYLDFQLGGQTVYIPTFNKNKDSLEADVNGTFKGGGEGKPFTDYKSYTIGTTGVTGTEIYSITNGPANGTKDEDKKIITLASQTHYPQLTPTASVISMEEWNKKPDGEKMGPFWVYDKDGWAYWAEPLLPGAATGLLLDEVQMTTVPDRNWYYAINVVGQFVTRSDTGKDNSTGFYDTSKGKAPSQDAEKLLKILCEGGTTQRPALSSDLSTQVRNAKGTTTTVTIDGTEFYVLDVTENQALLFAKNLINGSQSKYFGGTNRWKDSIARAECQRWLEGLPTLSRAAVPQPIRTRTQYNETSVFVTGDRAFLLTEADLFDKVNGSGTALPDDYTLGKMLITDQNRSILRASNTYWLRSPGGGSSHVSYVSSGSWSYTGPSSGYYLRPAVVVNLAAAGG